MATLGDMLYELFVLVVGEVTDDCCISFYAIYSHVSIVVPFY